MTQPEAAAGGESTRTVVIAFLANLAIAIAKSVAAVLTGSASMVAEAAHSWSDTGNEILLLVADRRSRRPADTARPLGYGREAYVWSLLAAVGLFVAGAAVSVWHGISELIHETPGQDDYLVGYLVLAVAFALEGVSWLQAVRQLGGEARDRDSDLLDYVMDTSDPTTRAVFAEDSAALIGILIAATGMGLHQATGNPVWDALGSVLVGVLLGVVAVVLIDRNRRFLTGEPADARVHAAAVTRIAAMPDVAAVRFVRLEYVGPRVVFLVASVDLVGDPAESSIAATLRRLETELERDTRVAQAVLTVAGP